MSYHDWKNNSQPVTYYNMERSTFITIIKYNVLENDLGKWLWDEFGDSAFYEADSESGAGYWKVTAPRKISDGEQQRLRGKPKKRRTLTR